MVASCSSFLTLGHSYGLSQLCWGVLNIKKQRKKISSSLGCMQVYFFLSLEVNQRHQEAKELTFWKVFISFLEWLQLTLWTKPFKHRLLLLGKSSQSTPTSIPLFIAEGIEAPWSCVPDFKKLTLESSQEPISPNLLNSQPKLFLSCLLQRVSIFLGSPRQETMTTKVSGN